MPSSAALPIPISTCSLRGSEKGPLRNLSRSKIPQRCRLGKGIGQTRGRFECLEVVVICDHLRFLHCRQGASPSAPTFFGTNIVARVSPPAISMTRFLDAMGYGESDLGAGGD